MRRGIRVGPSGSLFVGNSLRYLSQLLVLVVAARVYGPESAGVYGLALAATAPIFVVGGLGLRAVFLTSTPRSSLRSFRRVRTWSALVCVALVAFVAGLVRESGLGAAMVVVAVAKALDSFPELNVAMLQDARRVSSVPGIFGAQLLASFSGAALVFTFRPSFLGALIACAFIPSLVGSTVSAAMARRIGIRDERAATAEKADAGWREAWGLARTGLPVGLSNGVVVLGAAIPQYALGLTQGPAEVSRYIVLTYSFVAVEMVLNPMAQAWMPIGRREREKGEFSYRSVVLVSLRWAAIATPFGVLSVLVVAALADSVLGSSYRFSPVEVALAIAVSLELAAVFAVMGGLTVANRYRSLLWINGLSVTALAAGAVLGTYHAGVGGGLAAVLVANSLRVALGSAMFFGSVRRRVADEVYAGA